MSNPLVSVIIPFYNSSKFIEQTLSSVVKQSYQNIEIIVFDDGSEPTESIALEKTLSKYLVNWKTLLSLSLATTKKYIKTSFFVAMGGVFYFK